MSAMHAAKPADPLRIYCKNCSAPVGFDIINQTYRCAHCGETSGIQEVRDDVLEWRELSKRNKKARKSTDTPAQEYTCPSCGARVAFAQGDASETCDFCGSKLVRGNLVYESQYPDLVIPFFITPDEARERMIDWAQKNKRKPEAQAVLSNMDKFKGYYLPYQLVRGPVHGFVSRDASERDYSVAGFVEGAAVSVSQQLDNLVLNDMEPFDWSAARPFERGYVAGIGVKLPNLSDKETEARVIDEVTSGFRPEAERAMQTTGIDVTLFSDGLAAVSVLLPVYFIVAGDLTVAMNGQTGRIAASLHREKKTVPWVIEPLVLTVLLVAILNFFIGFDFETHVFRGISAEFLFYSTAVLGLIIFCSMGNGRRSLIRRITQRSAEARATREQGQLAIEEGAGMLKNPFDNTPVFFEDDGTGRKVPVKIRFYTFGRVVSIIIRCVLYVAAPLLVAAFLRWATMGEGEDFFASFNPLYGAAWYVLTAFVVLIYWVRGVRNDVYNHPILYEMLPNGKLRKIGTRASRKVGLLSMLGFNRVDKNGKRATLRDTLWTLGGAGIGILIGVAILFLGSTLAIITPD